MLKRPEAGPQDRPRRRQGRGRADAEPRSLLGARLRRPRGVRLHHQGGGRRPRLVQDRRHHLSQSRRASSSATATAASSRTWTSCPSSRPSTSATCEIENYFGGYLKHPYMSFYTGRGCKSRCTFCLWPQTVGGHNYRTRSIGHVMDELRYARAAFPAGEGVLLRRRHADRQPAAHRGAGDGRSASSASPGPATPRPTCRATP